MNAAAVSCWCSEKKNGLCCVLKVKGGGEKENSLVLFYVVCVQLEPKRTRGMGRERGDGVSREERG